MTLTSPEDECWRDLADAIVLLAVEDWRRARLQMTLPSLETRSASSTARSCERFFVSHYFNVLTDLDGSCFLRRLKEGFGFK